MAQATGTNWGALASGLAPLAIGAAGYLTAQPSTTTTTASPQFLTAGQQNLFNQGVSGLQQAGAQPYAANNWLTNYQQMLAGIATDPTLAQSYGQTAETIGGLSNQLGNMSGGANWINDPSRMTADITAAQNPWNNLVRDQTMQYAEQAAERGNTADRAGAAANASGFGDRSQIALELGKDKRQQGLNSLSAQLNQQGYGNALSQANLNNTTARSDLGTQSGFAQLQPQLGQQARGVMLDNANLLGKEGTAQRDYATTNATNLINAGSKTMGNQTVQSTPANPWQQGMASGLAAFSPAVSSGISGLVNSAAPAVGSALGSIGGSIWDGLSAAGDWLGGLFEDGGHVHAFADGGKAPARELPADTLARLRMTYATPRTAFRGDDWRDKAAVVNTKPDTRPKFARGGLAHFSEGGILDEDENAAPVPTEMFAQELLTPLPPPPQMGPRPQAAEAAPGITRGGASFTPPAPNRQPSAPPVPARGPAVMGGQNMEDEFVRRLMAAPDPAEMRAAQADERRAMADLMKEYQPRPDDWRQNLADIGVGMAASGDQSFGTSFAKGVSYADKNARERSGMERQARQALAKIQLDMSREGRKELTEAERSRLTTLASVLRERGASEDRRLIAEGQQGVLREGIASREQIAREARLAAQRAEREAREAREERATTAQGAAWDALLARQEPSWQRAAENAAKNIHPDDAPAFIEDFIQRRRAEFEARTPRPGTPRAAPAAATGAPAPTGAPTVAPTGATPMAAPAQPGAVPAPAQPPAAVPAPVAQPPAPTAPAAPAPTAPEAPAYRPKPPKALPAAAMRIQNETVEQIGTVSNINADLGKFVEMIDAGTLDFGLLTNPTNRMRNKTGRSNEQSRNFSTFESNLERLRNESLRLNAGVQTDGDAQRAWNELIRDINDPALVKQRLQEIQRINERGAALKQNQIDLLRSEHGLPPLDTSQFRRAVPAVGGGAPAQGGGEWSAKEIR